MSDIAFRLASEVLEASGFSCLHAEEVTIRSQQVVRLTIASVGRRKAKGARIWLRSRKQAERTMAELLSSDRRSSRHKDGLLVGAAPEDVDQVMRRCAHRLGYSLTEDQHLDVTLDSMIKRIDVAIEALRRSGGMKALNREYQQHRQARGQVSGDIAGTLGTKGTSYADWLVDRLKTRFQGLHHNGAITHS